MSRLAPTKVFRANIELWGVAWYYITFWCWLIFLVEWQIIVCFNNEVNFRHMLEAFGNTNNKMQRRNRPIIISLPLFS